MYIGAIRNLLYLPMTILYLLIGIPLSIAMISIPRKRFASIHQSHQEKETERRIGDVGAFVSPGDSLLDIGCGNGQFGEAMARAFGADVRGVDVVNYANSDIPIGIYDGVSLPFEDDSFDVIVMAMMLHHVEHQEELFDEAIRCSRRALIIYEDTYFSSWQRLAVVWNDFYSNMVYGVIKIYKGLEGRGVLRMPLPFTFRSVEEWNELFAKKRLENRATIVHHLGIKPHSKVTFLLEKS